jgi:hypothetical protein
MPADIRVRLDPWEPEYEGAVQVAGDEETPADIDTQVESATWEAIRPAAATPGGPLYFVDGVRRIEHRILAETTERTLFGLLGSFAVGATRVAAGAAAIVGEHLERLCVAGGGLSLPPMEVRLPSGGAPVVFQPRSVAENSPEAALQGLQNTMRECEAALAASLGDGDATVFLDGPLTFFTTTSAAVVGFVKRLLRSYLPPDKALLLRTLAIGQRTPIFLIKDVSRRRYSWYARIASGRPIDSTLTGIVRLETSSGLDLQTVRRLADLGTAVLPRFASAHGRDPRAPQNLYPIAGLEQALRHRLGDTLLIRRAIEAYLHGA